MPRQSALIEQKRRVAVDSKKRPPTPTAACPPSSRVREKSDIKRSVQQQQDARKHCRKSDSEMICDAKRFIFLLWLQVTLAWHLTLYEDWYRGGRRTTIEGGPQNCTSLRNINLTDPYGQKPNLTAVGTVSGVNPWEGCIRIYADPDCQQLLTILTPTDKEVCYSFEWPDCPYNDLAQSVSSCELDVCQHGLKLPYPPHEPQLAPNFTEEARVVDMLGPGLPHDFSRAAPRLYEVQTGPRKRRQLIMESHTIRSGEVISIGYKLGARNVLVPKSLSVFMVQTMMGFNPFLPYFQDAHYIRFHDLDGKPGDDRGHLLAKSLGGFSESWNLAPQSYQLNRGNGVTPNWRTMEIRIKAWLLTPCHQVNWNLVLQYHGPTNRPDRFDLDVKFYHSHHGVLALATHIFMSCWNDAQAQCQRVIVAGK
jgi:DNA/RNA non-specific endonuclease